MVNLTHCGTMCSLDLSGFGERASKIIFTSVTPATVLNAKLRPEHIYHFSSKFSFSLRWSTLGCSIITFSFQMTLGFWLWVTTMVKAILIFFQNFWTTSSPSHVKKLKMPKKWAGQLQNMGNISMESKRNKHSS